MGEHQVVSVEVLEHTAHLRGTGTSLYFRFLSELQQVRAQEAECEPLDAHSHKTNSKSKDE